MQASNPITKDYWTKNVVIKEREQSPMHGYEEDGVYQNIEARTQSFQKVHVEIPSYDGSIDTKILEYQLYTYFDLYNYNSEDKVILAWLKSTRYTLVWWKYLQINDNEDVS